MIIFLSELLQTTMKYIIIINNTKFMEIFRVSTYKSISLLKELDKYSSRNLRYKWLH